MYTMWKILLSNMSRPETFGMTLVCILLYANFRPDQAAWLSLS